MTRTSWLEAHPYLRPVADLAAEVETSLATLDVRPALISHWDDYRHDFVAGVPLLSSADASVDLEPGGRMTVELVERLATSPSTTWVTTSARALESDLRRTPDLAARIVDVLVADATLAPEHSGLLRYLAWTATARFLRPVIEAFASWRDEERWGRRYCPTCGSLPSMAQLIGADTGRRRLLSCGCCSTRWSFTRTACPFCESDAQRLSSLTLETEGGLRIDHCQACRGYLKTYDGQGNEALLLADWSSLHLDLVASDRGLKRLAASLFDFKVGPSS